MSQAQYGGLAGGECLFQPLASLHAASRPNLVGAETAQPKSINVIAGVGAHAHATQSSQMSGTRLGPHPTQIRFQAPHSLAAAQPHQVADAHSEGAHEAFRKFVNCAPSHQDRKSTRLNSSHVAI